MASDSPASTVHGHPDVHDVERNPEKHGASNDEDKFQVTLDDSELPLSTTTARKWATVLTISLSSTCVTCASSMASATFPHISQRFQVGLEVSTLSVSLYVLGLGLGPLLMGGLSESFGRNVIYRVSFLWFWLLTFPVAFANNIAVHLIFRFFTGFAGSSFLSVAGGSVVDLFPREKVSTPMAIFTLSPFIGPVIGPVVSGFINQNANWRWTYYTLLIWEGLQLVALFVIVPETLVRALLVSKAKRLRKKTGDDRYYAPSERNQKSVASAIRSSIITPFRIMLSEPIAFLINLWNSVILGIVYMFFSAFPVVFGQVHGFNQQSVGLTYLGIGLGMICATASQPIWNRISVKVGAEYKEKGETPPPEETLLSGMWGAVLVPIGLYMFAFTVYKHVHWIVPIILIIPFGTGTIYAFTSSFTYLVSAYRSYAASALASNSFMRSCFAAGLPLAARAMFRAMTNTGAIAFLAGVTTILAPLPFLFYRYGAKLRGRSQFAS